MANYGNGRRSMGGPRRRGGGPRRTGRSRSTRPMRQRTRGRSNMMGRGMNRGSNIIMRLPDLPPGHNLRHIVDEGGDRNSGKSKRFLCPEPRISDDCIEATAHQQRIIANGDDGYGG